MKDQTFDRHIGRLDKIFIEDPKRAIVIGCFLLAAIILLVIFWDKLKSLWASFRTNQANNSMLKDYEEETGETTTLTKAAYYQLANQLYNAFNQHIFGWGTDEDAIFNVFNQLNNTSDLLKLISEFGTRDGKDLPAYMRSELSKREINQVNTILNNKRIQYAF